MKCNNYIYSRVLALAVALTVTLLAQVNTSHGLDCYVCVFIEHNNATGPALNTSATCENSPTKKELITVSRASLASSSAVVLQGLKGMGASQELNQLLLSSLTAAPKPNNSSLISISTNQRNPENSGVVMDRKLETDATEWIYCSLSTFNIQGYGRVVLRSAATANGDFGATYCDNKMIPDSGFDSLPTTNVSSCICRVSGCNGKTITAGAEKAGQSIAFLILSIGIAILALTSFGQ